MIPQDMKIWITGDHAEGKNAKKRDKAHHLSKLAEGTLEAEGYCELDYSCPRETLDNPKRNREVLATCECVCVLPGWDKCKVAMHEVSMALLMGMDVYDFATREKLDLDLETTLIISDEDSDYEEVGDTGKGEHVTLKHGSEFADCPPDFKAFGEILSTLFGGNISFVDCIPKIDADGKPPFPIKPESTPGADCSESFKNVVKAVMDAPVGFPTKADFPDWEKLVKPKTSAPPAACDSNNDGWVSRANLADTGKYCRLGDNTAFCIATPTGVEEGVLPTVEFKKKFGGSPLDYHNKPETLSPVTYGDVQSKRPETVLDTAAKLVDGDRQAEYGHPLDDFGRTAKMWEALIGYKFSPHDVALMMILLKVSREKHCHKQDNLVDIAGYARTDEKCYTEQLLRDALEISSRFKRVESECRAKLNTENLNPRPVS